MLMALTVFLILFVLIGSVSAAKDNTTTLTQDTTKEINQEKITTGSDESSLNKEILKTNNKNTTLKEPVSGGTFNDIQTAINNAGNGETIELSGLYTGDGTKITINKPLTIIGTNDATLDAKGKSGIFYITKEKITLKNIKFINGNSDSGGAIEYFQNFDSYECSIINCTFINNTANEGGAIGKVAFMNKIKNCTFLNNTANSGGAIYSDAASKFEISECTFTNNKANGEGGAIYAYGGKGNNVTNCNFTNNKAKNGGAIRMKESLEWEIKQCTFIRNTGSDGGAIYLIKGEDNKVNYCIFINNTGNKGGAIYWTDENNAKILNSNFKYNKAGSFKNIYTNKEDLTLSGCSLDTVVSIDPLSDCFTGSSAIVNLTFDDGTNIGGYNVILKNNNQTIKTFTYNSDHKYTYTWNNLAVGEYSITVNESNENNNKYIASYEPVHFTVYKKAINPNDINVIINPGKGNVTINIKAPTDFTNTMSIIIDGKNYTIPVIGGTGNKTIILTPGKHNLTGINITDNPIYNDTFISKTDGNFTVYKIDIDPSDVNVTVTPDKGNANINIKAPTDFTGNVIIIIDNVSYPVELVNGVGFKAIILQPGNHNLTGVNITNNTIYNDTFIPENISFVVLKKDTIITAEDISFIINYGGHYTISTNLGSGKTITLIINNQNINAITDANGVATFELTKTNLAPAGVKTTTITFNGDDNYNSKTINTKITVNKETTKITGKSAKKTYKKTANKKIQITLKDSTGKSLRKVKINLKAKKLKGKLGKKLKKGYDITVKFNSKGIGYITLKNSKVNGFKKGTYKFSVTYKGSDVYTSSTNQIKMKIK